MLDQECHTITVPLGRGTGKGRATRLGQDSWPRELGGHRLMPTSVVTELSSYRVPVDSPIVPEPAPTTRRLCRCCKKLITRTFAEFQSGAHGTEAVIENVCS